MKVQELTKTEFLKKVANYEARPNKWVYKGDKPCIVDLMWQALRILTGFL